MKLIGSLRVFSEDPTLIIIKLLPLVYVILLPAKHLSAPPSYWCCLPSGQSQACCEAQTWPACTLLKSWCPTFVGLRPSLRREAGLVAPFR